VRLRAQNLLLRPAKGKRVRQLYIPRPPPSKTGPSPSPFLGNLPRKRHSVPLFAAGALFKTANQGLARLFACARAGWIQAGLPSWVGGATAGCAESGTCGEHGWRATKSG
jgi:hypothetical protein